VPLNDNQYGALVSFTYNLGCGNLQSSTLLSELNGGKDPNTVAGKELPKFVLADGVKLNGLVRRRNAEVKLFQTPSNVGALPPRC
jgi:lysozyme